MSFEPYFPAPINPGELWIDWHEVLHVNANVLVRCVALPGTPLPERASSLILNFDYVDGLRVSEDPFNLEEKDFSVGLPREANKHLSSPLLRSTSTPWIEAANIYYPVPLFHFVIFDVRDRAVGVLTRSPYPTVRFECRNEEFEPNPNDFRTWKIK